ncbi:type II toxin-antitoxin system VapC family toxin [Streptomyces sp. NPDC101178]|uniref:type II toxin-antitoxin system VapC family toxin n=1 Tax=Streptomyces sp. NPDC101178 TaxID=3366124 RepID=UPI00382720D0
MRLLLDTRDPLVLGDSDELSDQVKDLLDTEPSVHLSAVSAWEIAIKQSLGKLDGRRPGGART